MIAAAGASYWMLTADTFDVGTPHVTGDLRYTNVDSLVTSLAISRSNLFQLDTSEIHGALVAQPGIESADVSVALPDRLDIAVIERAPVFALRHDGSTVLVDADGLILAGSDPAQATSLGLPLIDDLRSTPSPEANTGEAVDPVAARQPGMTLDPIDVAAILQLGAVTPALINSSAASLTLSVSDDNGYVISAQPTGWQAIFGQYTPNLRPTDIIARQVQCLRSLLGAAEPQVHTVYLAPLDDRCGTYLPDATPRAASTPSPAR